MKILQLIHKTQTRGAEIFTCQLSNHLMNAGHEVKIVTIFQGTAQLPFKGNISSLKAFSSKGVSFEAIKRLSLIIKDFGPHLVQTNSGDTLKYAVISKLLFKWDAPIVVRNASEVGKYLTSRLQKIVYKFLYKRVERIISVSRASEKDIIEHFPFLQGKTEVIGVGLEKNEVNQVTFPADKKHIVHVGGFSFEKNHKGLLRIFRIILARYPEAHLHLVGDGPLKKQIMEETWKLHLKESVTFHGFVNNPLAYILSGDVLVLPSIIEGLPGVILEAMYCKTPVVAYNVGGIAEILNEKTGFLIEKDEEKSFTEAVFKALEQPDCDVIDNAYNMVKDQFMNERLALKFVNTYRKIVLERE